jgi:hypothetical protein
MEIGTLFFHQAITKRRRRNTIVYVKDENDIVQFMPNKISNTFVNYFRNIFASQNSNHGRPFMHTQLPIPSHDYTYTVPRKQELWETLTEMKRNASPGPDGLNVEFYIATWSWIGDDVCILVRSFFSWEFFVLILMKHILLLFLRNLFLKFLPTTGR